MERNRVHHGHFITEQTGEFHLITEEHCGNPDDSYPTWEPEITIFLTDMGQLPMIRVVDPRGTEHRLEMGENDDGSR